MEIRPILSALLRSKVSMILIGLQVALTLAIVSNALFIVSERLERMQRPSGMNEADTFLFNSTGFGQGYDVKSAQQGDLQLLRGLPGVVDATSIISVPMSESGWSTGVSLQPRQATSTANTALYMVDAHGLSSYGLKLVEGRDFRPEEIGFRSMNDRNVPTTVIITRALAARLFPQGGVLGKQVYYDNEGPPTTIIGIVDHLQTPWLDADFIDNSSLMPAYLPYGNVTRYLVRAEPGRRDEVMQGVEQAMIQANPSRIIGRVRTMEQVRADGYAGDRAMAIILGAVIVALLAITALGIVGMASFWVAQRTRQIGTRRALGATRWDILRYFHTENFIITTLGLVVGGVLAYALSLWLMREYQAPRLPWHYVPVGFACLWLLGQLAVLGPALRASRVPPALATRSV